ncbi:MAG: ABC transporter substrate-binding protein [Pseudolabrys sp.]
MAAVNTTVSAGCTDLATVTVNVFPGGFNWGIYVGQSKGFFGKYGIAVSVEATPNSVAQMTDFAGGIFDIAMTAFDNIVAYVEGQGQAPIGPQPEFFAFMGSDTGFLSLVASPAISDIAQLKGKRLSVDAMTTGYAFVLYDMMRRNNLNKDAGDCQLSGAGGMAQRWAALRDGSHEATLLSAPYNLIAREAGFTELARAVDVIGPYQGNVAAARRSWAAANADKVTAYIRGYRDSIEWLYQAGNRAEAIAILRHSVPHLSQSVAKATYPELLHPTRGFCASGEFDRAGMQCVLELRERYGLPAKKLGAMEKYCNESFLRASRS